MASIGLKYSAAIDSIGDIVTGDLQTCWKCQEGTHALAENRQFYRICVSQTAWLDSDGRSHWPHRVMHTCQYETGLKCRLLGEYYIMVNRRLAGQQQSNSLSRLKPFYYRYWRRCKAAQYGMDRCMGFWWDDPDRSTQREVEYISVHQCQMRRAYSVDPHTVMHIGTLSWAWEWFKKCGITFSNKETHHFCNILRT